MSFKIKEDDKIEYLLYKRQTLEQLCSMKPDHNSILVHFSMQFISAASGAIKKPTKHTSLQYFNLHPSPLTEQQFTNKPPQSVHSSR